MHIHSKHKTAQTRILIYAKVREFNPRLTENENTL